MSLNFHTTSVLALDYPQRCSCVPAWPIAVTEGWTQIKSALFSVPRLGARSRCDGSITDMILGLPETKRINAGYACICTCVCSSTSCFLTKFLWHFVCRERCTTWNNRTNKIQGNWRVTAPGKNKGAVEETGVYRTSQSWVDTLSVKLLSFKPQEWIFWHRDSHVMLKFRRKSWREISNFQHHPMGY